MKIEDYSKIKNFKLARQSHSSGLKIIVVLVVFFFVGLTAHAQSANEIRDKIQDHTEEIKKLDEEIKKWEQEVNAKQQEAKTLQNVIQVLDTNAKKVTTEIKKTETNISKTNLTITQLADQINLIESRIGVNTDAIAETLNNLNKTDDRSIVELFLSSESMAVALDRYESADQFQDSIRTKTAELNNYKDQLQGKKVEVEGEKKQLVNLKTDLSDQKNVLDINKKEKNTLLADTKSKESEYQKILAQKQAEKASFEAALFELANQLQYVLDPSTIPLAGKDVLAWPLKDVFVTQLFGKTGDSGRLYTSGTHDGIDFRAPVGTPVLAAQSGVVYEINQGAVQNCQYGKWIVVKHANGLATLYAHLSDIKVAKGQSVAMGQTIGYSGNTGYATGPHLHFTVYAAEALSLKQYTCKSGRTVTIPIASKNAYLDPMKYFPSIN